MLPCIGSQTQATWRAGGGDLLDEGRQRLADPAGAHPGDEGEPAGLAVGVELVDERSSVVGVGVRPSLTPIGLRTEATKSTCAPSRSRVRSPTQTKWPETSYGVPVRESMRVSGALVVEHAAPRGWSRTRPVRIASESAPQACMKVSARSISLASRS